MGIEFNNLLTSAPASEQAELIREAFPEMKCLRCNHDNFYILPNMQNAMFNLGVVVIACTRCGFVEQHLIGMLKRAAKPIDVPPT